MSEMNITVESTTVKPQEATAPKAQTQEAKAEVKTSAAVEQTAETANESDTLENETSEENSEETEAQEENQEQETLEAKPKKNGFKKRIDKLRSQISAKDAELAELRAKVAGQTSQDSKAEKPQAAKADSGKPNPDQFDTHTEYVEALTDWKLEQKLAAKDQAAKAELMKSEQEKRFSTHAEKVEALRSEVDDLDDALEAVDHIPVSLAVQEAILDSENSARLMYELIKDAANYERICKLPPLAAAKAIGAIEDRLARASEEKTKPEPKKQTKAPPPLSTVGAKASVQKSPSEMSADEYIAWRQGQMKRK